MKVFYRVENFKAFKDTGYIDLSKISVFCGQNSAGKSSIIKSLLCLKQSAEIKKTRSIKNNNWSPLVLNGPYTKLGSWKDTVYDKNRNNDISFSWRISGENNEIFKNIEGLVSNNYMLRNTFQVKEKKEREINLGCIVCSSPNENEELSVKLKNFFVNMDDNLTSLHPSSHERWFFISLSDVGSIIKNSVAEIFFPLPGIKEIFKILSAKKFSLNTGDLRVDFSGPFPISIAPILNKSWVTFFEKIYEICEENFKVNKRKNPEWLNKLKQNIETLKSNTPSLGAENIMTMEFHYLHVISFFMSRSIEGHFNLFISLLSPLWKRLRYVGPLRSEPQRFYLFDDAGGVDIGNKGEFTVQVLALEQKSEVITRDSKYDEDGNFTFGEEIKANLLDSTNKWLTIMGLPIVKTTRDKSSLYEVEVGSTKDALPDVGFGVSQVLPIIVETLRCEKGDIIILEQPEIHLHPSVQSVMADFFISRAIDGVRIVIETHSEYLIKRLCRRIAECRDDLLRNMTHIYFIEKDSHNESMVQNIKMNTFGEITEWPEGFFDSSDSLFWAKASLKKRKLLSNKSGSFKE